MKKLNYLLIALLLATSFISCEKDDDTAKVVVEESDITGSWNVVSYKMDNGKTTTTYLNETYTATFTYTGYEYDYTMILNADYSTDSEGSFYTDTTVTAFGETETETQLIDGPFGEAWELRDGNKLYFKNNGLEAAYTISEYSEDSMTLTISLSELNEFLNNDTFFDFDIEGVTIKTSGNVYMILNR